MPALKNARHEAFCLALLEGKTQADAYIAAGYKANDAAARANGSKLLTNANIASRIEELKDKAAEGAVMSAREVLEELTKLGRTNMLDYVRLEGSEPILDFSNLTREQAAAIAEVTVETRTERGKGEDEDPVEVSKVRFKLADKRAALVDLGKHHDLFVEKHKIEVTGIAEQLSEALARVDGDGKRFENRNSPRARNARKTARKGAGARPR